MTRLDKLLATVRPEVQTKSQQTLDKIRTDFNANQDAVKSSFADAFQEGLQKVESIQFQKGKIKLIHISYLLSSLLLGRCEFRVDFYNNNIYLDKTETVFYWQVDFINQYIQADFDYFQSLLRTDFARVTDYEVHNISMDFGRLYLAAFTNFWTDIVSNLSLKKHAHLFEDNVEIVYGGFQDISMNIANIVIAEEK